MPQAGTMQLPVEFNSTGDLCKRRVQTIKRLCHVHESHIRSILSSLSCAMIISNCGLFVLDSESRRAAIRTMFDGFEA